MDDLGARWALATYLSLLNADFAEPHRMRTVVGGFHSTFSADVLGAKHNPAFTQVGHAPGFQGWGKGLGGGDTSQAVPSVWADVLTSSSIGKDKEDKMLI